MNGSPRPEQLCSDQVIGWEGARRSAGYEKIRSRDCEGGGTAPTELLVSYSSVGLDEVIRYMPKLGLANVHCKP